MKRIATTRQLKFATLGLATALLLAGCGTESTLAPQGGSFPGNPILLPEAEVAALSPLSTVGRAPSVEATISAAEGGTLRLGRMTLSFPAGALREDTRISMTLTDRTTLRVELLPHGIHFQKPVTLSADLNGLLLPSTTTVGIAWYNDQANTWQVMSESPASGRQARALLQHFSSYEVFGG